MNLLLDTHIFLWYIAGSELLSPGLRNVLRDGDNAVYLSVVSVWESVVKHQL